MQNKKFSKLLKIGIAIVVIILIALILKPLFVRAKPINMETVKMLSFENQIETIQVSNEWKTTREKVFLKIDTEKYKPIEETKPTEVIVEAIEEEIKNDTPTVETKPSKENTSTDKPKKEKPVSTNNEKEEKPHSDNYVGRFKVPALGINVACYSGSSQSIVDAKDSAAYFYFGGHAVIGDHKNQGFNAIKSATVGMKATLGSTKYKCVAKIKGRNTGSSLTDTNGTSISKLYPGTLVTYTCNENWKNITIVFWESQDSDGVDCSKGVHLWKDWEIAREFFDNNGKYYGWDKRVCKLCQEEEWEPRNKPSENCKPPVKETEPPAETEPETTPPPVETEPPIETEPPVEETKPTEPPVQETEPKLEETLPTEPIIIPEESEPT